MYVCMYVFNCVRNNNWIYIEQKEVLWQLGKQRMRTLYNYASKPVQIQILKKKNETYKRIYVQTYPRTKT